MLLRDLKYQPQVNHLVMEKLRRRMEERAKDRAKTANFHIATEDGNVVDYIGQSCHFNIGYTTLVNRHLVGTELAFDRMYLTKFPGQEAVEGITLPKKGVEDAITFFVEWLVKDSHYARFVLNPDDTPWLLKYGLIVSADMPSTILQNLMIITRHIRECHPRAFVKFNALVESGINSEVAFYCCFNTTYSTSGKLPPNSPFSNYPGHRSYSNRGLKDIPLMVRGEIGKYVPLHLYKVKADYNGGSRIFTNDGPDNKNFIEDVITSDKELQALLRSHRGESGLSTYHPPNPFQKPSTGVLKANQATFEEVFDVILPYMQQTGYFDPESKKGYQNYG